LTGPVAALTVLLKDWQHILIKGDGWSRRERLRKHQDSDKLDHHGKSFPVGAVYDRALFLESAKYARS
jgi:hypothetical protein